MIRTQGLGKTYWLEGNPPSRIDVLRGVDLEIREGEFVALLGPSGSGKSTLLGILAGLDAPTEGRVEVAGHDLTGMNEEELTRFRGRNLGFIFQAYHLIPTLTAWENVALPLELSGQPDAFPRAREWLARVGMESRKEHLPKQLSGGEQQRVAIARALVAQPRVIFADEPTGNLDSDNGAKVIEVLLGLRGSATIVMVTHDVTMAKRADRIIAMQDGRVVSS